jgi:hypothetical protein
MLTRRALNLAVSRYFRCASDCKVQLWLPALWTSANSQPHLPPGLAAPICRSRCAPRALAASRLLPQSQPATARLASPSGRPELFATVLKEIGPQFEVSSGYKLTLRDLWHGHSPPTAGMSNISARSEPDGGGEVSGDGARIRPRAESELQFCLSLRMLSPAAIATRGGKS